jgi:membrane protease YdiL (CAAX protease family)
MFRWGRASVAYAVIAASALVVGHVFDRPSLLSHGEPWLPLAGVESVVFSLVLGGAFAALVVLGTRVLVEHVGWAKKLHRDLRPITAQLDALGIVAIAALSALAEELVFRGLLQPWIGVLPQALLFGVAHAQLSGSSRWVWVAWATVVGLAFGAIYALSGSLLGAMLAHAVINGLNLAYLKAHDPAPPRHSLGGLLSDRRSPMPDRRSPLPSAGAAAAATPGRLPAGRRA